jgi:hypothetical protein
MFLLVNFNSELTSLPLPLPLPLSDTDTDTDTESAKEINLNVSASALASEPLAHLARFVANFLSESEGESLANACIVTVQPPASAAKHHSTPQEQQLPNEDEYDDKPGLDYNRLGEQLLLAAGLGSPEVFEQPPLPFTTSTPTDKPADYDYEWGFEAEAEAEAGEWNDRGPIVIIPPSDAVLSMFIGHALTHLLQAGDIWSPVYILTDPFSPTPKLVQWD